MDAVKLELKQMEQIGVIAKVQANTMVLWNGSSSQAQWPGENMCRFNSTKPVCLQREVSFTSCGSSLCTVEWCKIFYKVGCELQLLANATSPESTPLTTFLIPFGCFCFHRFSTTSISNVKCQKCLRTWTVC